MENSKFLKYNFQYTTKHGTQSNQKLTENILVITFKKSTLQLPAYRLKGNFSYSKKQCSLKQIKQAGSVLFYSILFNSILFTYLYTAPLAVKTNQSRPPVR